MGMKVAALYDVHGNLPALEAVLGELPGDVDAVVFGGDLVWGPWPRDCLVRAESLGERAFFVRGNCETLVLGGSGEYAWAREQLDDDQLRRIAAWPATATLDVDVLGATLFCHATPRSEDEILFAESPAARWADALAGVAEHTVVCGHTHLQFEREIAGHRVVNGGSVGAPTVRPVAWWALIGPDVELRTTSYDTEATIAAAAAFVPDVHGVARWLRKPPSSEERIAALGGVG
jgi:predicted phosphodiesterase